MSGVLIRRPETASRNGGTGLNARTGSFRLAWSAEPIGSVSRMNAKTLRNRVRLQSVSTRRHHSTSAASASASTVSATPDQKSGTWTIQGIQISLSVVRGLSRASDARR